MPWKRNDSDPLEIKRRKLAEQERLIAEQMSRLTEEMHESGEPMPEEVKRPEPPVWRLEDDAAHHHAVEPTPARKRNLARQRQRDMFIFIILGFVLILVLMMIWSACARITRNNGMATSNPSSGFMGMIRLLRPHHWTKNAFCFAGVVFGGFAHNSGDWLKAAQVFFVFCLASSTVYAWNDIFDRDRDRAHPIKRLRPLPSGQVSLPAAATLGLVLLIGTVAAGVGLLCDASKVCVLIYFAVNVAYTLWLKHIPLLDISCVAAGFILRVLAGIYPMDTPTAWIALLTMGLSLLLATAKRRSELARMEGGEISQRPVLRGYTLPLLDSLISSAATSTILFYALFTVLSDKNQTLVLTVPVVYYGIMRYKSHIMIRGGGEEPEMILLKDVGMQATIAIWLGLYIAILAFQPHWFR